MPAPVANTTNTLNLPLQSDLLDSNGNVTRAWIGVFKKIGQSDAVTCDTHANRAINFKATSRDLGQWYYETDRGALYLNLYNALTQQTWQWLAGTMSGTRTPDTRPTDLTATDVGFLFYATDMTVTYTWTGTAWAYKSGQMNGTLSPDLKPTLVADDAGFLFYSTDFAHTYKWSGAAWTLATGDVGSRFIGWYLGAPNAGVWHICDGTAGVTSSTGAGITVSVTMPNLIGSYVKGIAVYTGTVVAPIAPTFTGTPATTSATGSTTTGTTGGSAAPAGHTHTVTPAGTISATAEPQEVGLIPYYRL